MADMNKNVSEIESLTKSLKRKYTLCKALDTTANFIESYGLGSAGAKAVIGISQNSISTIVKGMVESTITGVVSTSMRMVSDAIIKSVDSSYVTHNDELNHIKEMIKKSEVNVKASKERKSNIEEVDVEDLNDFNEDLDLNDDNDELSEEVPSDNSSVVTE